MSQDITGAFVHMMLSAMEGKSSDEAIRDYEKIEQQKMTRSSNRLPRSMSLMRVPDELLYEGINSDDDYDSRRDVMVRNAEAYTRKMYEKAGIEILEEYDDLFFSVRLPEGWKISSTDHTMWNVVKDDKCRVRLKFFYKGSFTIEMRM